MHTISNRKAQHLMLRHPSHKLLMATDKQLDQQ
jgi:hypothetical protein